MEQNDEDITKTFLPNIQEGETGAIIKKLLKDFTEASEVSNISQFKFYNMLEKLVLDIDLKEED